MLRFSKGLISIILFCSIILLGFINTSNADIEIESLYVYSSLTWDGYFMMMVDVQTSEPYHGIDYYLDDTWIDRAYGDGKRTVDFLWYDESEFWGSVKGTKHTLKLNVMQSAGDDIVVTETFKVYQPIVTSGYGTTSLEKPRNTGAYGWAEVSAHYFNGTDFVMEAYASFSNDSDVTLSAQAWFRQNEYILSDPVSGILTKSGEKRDTKAKLTYEPGGYDSWSPDSWVVNYPLGRSILPGEHFYYDAHTHLQVQTVDAGIQVQDDWEVDTGIQTFTKDDNP